ncbi:MAG TPA: GNAT family N-acetyltransferase [Dehalococcoidia bacterium]
MLRLSESQIKSAAEIAARAFRNDPVTRHLIPEESGRASLIPLYELDISYCTLYGETYATSPNLEGISAWLPPGQTDMPWRKVFSAGAWSLLFRTKPSTLIRLLRIFRAFAATGKRHVHFPHWYLSLLYVAPEHQGQGYAGALLSPMLARIDSKHLPCYLETTEQKNIQFYERYGFRVTEITEVPGTSLRFWAMLRDGRK